LKLAKEIEGKMKAEWRTGEIPEYKKEGVLTFSEYMKKYFIPF
jgi:hypothetical protein